VFEQGEITEFLKIMKGEKSKSELERSGEMKDFFACVPNLVHIIFIYRYNDL